MISVARNPNFQGIIQQIREQILPVLEGRMRCIDVGIRCYSGRHRSVAVANLLTACLGDIPGIRSSLTNHTLVPCGCPDACRNNNDPQQARRWEADGLLALSMARHAWAHASI